MARFANWLLRLLSSPATDYAVAYRKLSKNGRDLVLENPTG